MSVLCIDTSSRQRVVALLATRGGIVETSDVRIDVSVGVGLPLALDGLIDAGIEAIVVVVGPGSYTGLRAGMSAALGIAHARGIPLHGVATLDAVAAGWAPGAEQSGVVAVDAGRGSAYAADCSVVNARWEPGSPRRIALSDLLLVRGPVASTDDLPVLGLVRVDPASALAASVPRALGSAPLPSSGLAATYVG
ncbi:MAG TPA: tRNA (adenosine(37)-N6)-threonylcarbamoyltransferase complex dimerization subunit type 1 TsaB [Candidatus Acidoferrales bacterium]|jgi:tRNA threonylcarbamoyl adenosine modification protein YeaZ|nr:tRNA (adenosine(37)-N6)-threonylcarbamoyltransferase complex dimerization subunit type 1 TsaB [Candidatus Acidoferrales bacterium]